MANPHHHIETLDLRRSLASLNTTYRCLTVVSHPVHCERIVTDPDRLIVSCDWMLWQNLLGRGIDAIYVEAGLTDWDGGDIGNDIYLRAVDWGYVDGRDVTVFAGVSLARQFVRDTHLFIYAYWRLRSALDALVKVFLPQELELVDLRTELPILTSDQKRSLTAEVAAAHSIDFIDSHWAVDENDAAFPVGTQNYRIDDNLLTSPRSFVLRAYEMILDRVSRIRAQIGAPKDLVLVVAALFTILPLLETLQYNRTAPAIFAWRAPNKRNFGFLFRCLRNGVRWLAPRRLNLSGEQRDTVQQAIDRLRAEWRGNPQDCATEALRAFVAEHIMDAGRFEMVAREVLACQEIVDRLKPKRLLIDALENPTIRILCALAHQNGIPVDYTWHGVYIQALKSDLLGSDPREPAYVSRSLTWGEHNEWWLRAIGSPVEMTRIGHPYASKVRKEIRVQRWDHALVLQGAPGIHDIKGLHHNQYVYFVRIVRALMAQGVDDIRFKLHQGAWRVAYYDRIKAFFNLHCEVVVDGPFEDHVTWSDFVIGPTGSGAMAETLALGRPYFPVSLPPNGADTRVVRMFKSYEDLDSLLEALENHECPDLMEPAQKLLGDWKSGRDDGATWRAVESAVRSSKVPAWGPVEISEKEVY